MAIVSTTYVNKHKMINASRFCKIALRIHVSHLELEWTALENLRYLQCQYKSALVDSRDETKHETFCALHMNRHE